jgi:hypothetical protein
MSRSTSCCKKKLQRTHNVSNVDFIQIMHQRTLVSQYQRGVRDHMSCQRRYLVVCESELDFLTIFLDSSCVFRSNNKFFESTLFLEWLQEICDRAEFPKKRGYTLVKIDWIESHFSSSAFRLPSASSMSWKVLPKFVFSANLSRNLSIRTCKLSTALRLSPVSCSK